MKGYYEKFKNTTVLLWNDEYELYVKSDPEKGYFAKKPGGKEYPVEATSNLVVRAIDGMEEVSLSEYEK